MRFALSRPHFALLTLLFFQPAGAAAAPPSFCLGALEKLFSPSTDVVPLARRPTIPIARRALTEFVDEKSPWLKMTANSEQRQPIYLGATPREMELLGQRAAKPALPRFMSERGHAQAQLIRKHLAKGDIELEAWPVRNDHGQLTWAFSRWRKGPRKGTKDEWKWIDGAALEKQLEILNIPPILPKKLMPTKPGDFTDLFTDFAKREDLYAKPAFGDAVFTDASGKTLHGAWLSPDELPLHRMSLEQEGAKGLTAHVIPQPARFNDEAISFVLPVSDQGISWPKAIQWGSDAPYHPPRTAGQTLIKRWPDNFTEAFRRDVQILSGEAETVFPISGKKMRFTRKNSSDPENQLLDMVQYLEERYKVLGIQTRRQEFLWRDIPQSNLIAVIPGSAPPGVNRPVLIADHFDTAFAEDIFARTGKRISVPGADDNASATAGLLRSAEALKDTKPTNDIWLVHLTGEEFPADDLGARVLFAELLKNKQDISGVLLMDMIGHNKRPNTVFQISAGQSADSLKLAASAEAAAKAQAPWLTPAVRRRFDPRSYLYNTDGLIVSDTGYPVILFNERLNRYENLTRTGYHDMADTAANMDWEYATSILQTVIETAARQAR